MDTFSMNKLPEEIEHLIFSFIPLETLSLCTKTCWLANDTIKKHTSIKGVYAFNQGYCRFLIINDLNFIFDIFLRENIIQFKKKKKIIYHNKIFYNKIEFVRYLCRFYKGNKCLEILNDIIKTERLVFKNIRSRLNKWNN
jgi:hypothetical protein